MDDGFGIVLTIGFFVVVALGLVSAAPGDPKAESTLRSAGYTDTVITGSSMLTFRCGDSDWIVFDFNATNPAGDQTDGFVCCGVLKGCTVRH